MGGPRQHTISNFYLKEFLNSGIVYRRGAKLPRFVKKPKNVAVRINYYGGPSDNLNMLDKMNSAIEGWAAPVLKRLVYDVTSITHSDWVILSYYFANVHVRTPAFQDGMVATFKEFAKKVNKMVEDMKKAYEKAEAEGKDLSVFKSPSFDDSPRYSLDELNAWMEKLEQKEGRLDNLLTFYHMIKDIAGCIQKMSFHILGASGGLFFITTDRPLVLYSLISGSTLGAGWANKDALAAMALDPKHILVMCYRGEPAIYDKTLTPKDVQFWNIQLMKYAVYEVYSKFQYDIALDWMLRRGIWGKVRRANL
jgi:hypothetical protein